MARSKSSRRWLHEHFNDTYVKQAQQMGYRSRSAYKLLALQKSDRLLQPGMTVVDLGSAPGGWSQVAIEVLNKTGMVVAVDLLEMTPIHGVSFLQGDFTEAAIYEKLLSLLTQKTVAVILSDMAPNLSGNNGVDQPRCMLLAELTLEFAQRVLAPNGTLLVKAFQGEGFEAWIQDLKLKFAQVVIRKPEASRPRSREVYVVAKKFKAP